LEANAMSTTGEPDVLGRTNIVQALNLEAFPARGYRHGKYLESALAAGFDVSDLAAAHRVSKKTIYRAVDEHNLELQQPPSNGLSRALYEADPDAVGGD
jgi:hypothetical protein